jgi:uncharacterized protein (TIGR03118 family)
MRRARSRGRIWIAAASLLAAAVAAAALAAATPAAESNAYVVHNLVSDGFLPADHTDPNLVNAWGLTSLPGSPWWVADNGTDVSTLYTADGTPRPLVVSVPNAPTGAVSNTGPDFVVGSGPALFLFATEEGKILGWNMSLGTTAQVAVDRSGQDAIYKGLAIAGDRLYATDFHNGRVDVFDGSFNLVSAAGAFTDPDLPRGFAPFGIQNVGGTVVVTFAKQDAAAEDEVQGQGLGIVDAFDVAGKFLGRIGTRGQLNAPWGIAQAPAGFGRFSGDLLIGNFGDGEITAFGRDESGEWGPRGQLRDADNRRIAIDGLWALEFGHGAANNGPVTTLFFTAGPNDEEDGLFGSITAG